MSHDPSAQAPEKRITELEQMVTERDQQIHQLTEQLSMFQTLIDQIPDFLYAKDRHLRFVFGNRSVAASFGQDESSKVIGMSDADVFPPEVAEVYSALERRVIDSGQAELDVEQMVQNEHGENRWVLTNKIPWRNPAGEITGIIGIARDITERREQELRRARYNEELEQAVADRTRELATNEKLFRTLFSRAPLGIVITDHDKLIQINPAYLKMLGYTDANELIGQSLLDHIAPSARASLAEQISQRSRGDHDSSNDTTTVLRSDGSEFPALLETAQMSLAEGQQRLVSFISDLSSLQRAEAERLALSDQIIEAQRATLRELSTPLVPIADEVVAMPLVGSIDDRRASLIMETLLEGIVAQQAAFAIIDVTGVKIIDTHAASALLRVAQAAKLLGAQIILTGISAEIAQTIVHMGADLTGIVTCNNLQAGVAYAIERMKL